jgi:hypothetical protein
VGSGFRILPLPLGHIPGPDDRGNALVRHNTGAGRLPLV